MERQKKVFFIHGQKPWFLIDMGIFLFFAALAELLYYLLGGSVVIPMLTISVKCVAGAFMFPSPLAMFGMMLLGALFFCLAGVAVVILTFPILIIYRGARKSIRRNDLARASYDATIGFPYFRRVMENWSPAVVDYVISLSLNVESSFAATILDLEYREYIECKGRTIVVKKRDEQLPWNELVLLDILADEGKVSPDALRRWEAAVRREALDTKLLRYPQDKVNLLRRFLLCMVLCVIGYFSIMTFTPSIQGLVDDSFLQLINSSAMQPYLYSDITLELLAQVMGEMVVQQYVLMLAASLLFSLLGLLLFLAPLGFLSSLIGYFICKPCYSRTRAGNVMMEQAAALRAFLRDFSNLSEADQEQVALWGPYLVYAVALGENTDHMLRWRHMESSVGFQIPTEVSVEYEKGGVGGE